MSAIDALLFIDANKYLDLYRTNKGRMLLGPLGEQVDYIFVTQQVVAEVQRNKLSVASDFLTQKFRALKLQTFNVPDHLSGTTTGQGEDILQQMSEISQKVKYANKQVDALALGIIEQISRSEDEVSKALSPIFSKAVAHCPEDLQRARERRELGNPPGKRSNPIGDQLTWEQILRCFNGKRRLWIISRDGDYGTVYGGRGFLNQFLYNELCKFASAPEVYLFEDTVEGLQHFVETTGVSAKERLTPEEAEEIEKEEKALSHLTIAGEEYRRAATGVMEAALPGEEFRRAAADFMRAAQPGEVFRRAAADIMEAAQSGEEFRRAAAGIMEAAQPGEEFRRAAADFMRAAQPGEAFRRAAAGIMEAARPGEELRRAAAGIMETAQPGEEFRRAAAGIMEAAQPGEEFRRAAAGIMEAAQLGEEFRRAAADILRGAQLGEEFCRAAADLGDIISPEETQNGKAEALTGLPPSSEEDNEEDLEDDSKA